jgi:hypothetical protein
MANLAPACASGGVYPANEHLGQVCVHSPSARPFPRFCCVPLVQHDADLLFVVVAAPSTVDAVRNAKLVLYLDVLHQKGTNTRFTFLPNGYEVVLPSAEKDLGLKYGDWDKAWRIIKRVCLQGRPTAYPDLVAHHNNVIAVKDSPLGWEVAICFCVQQHKAIARDPRHDLATLVWDGVNLIHQGLMGEAMQAAVRAAANATAAAVAVSAKRPASGLPTLAKPQPAKQAWTQHPAALGGGRWCFCCSKDGCRPATCREPITVAGAACAALNPSSRSLNALCTSAGKTYCLGYATGRCLSVPCPRAHSCSICNGAHGAASCPVAA